MGVVVIVPAFAIANQAYEHIVTAILVRLVISVAPQVRDRVYRPGDVPHDHRPHKNTPHQKTCPKLNRFGRLTAHDQCGNKAAGEKQQPGRCNDKRPKAVSLKSLVKFVAANVFRVVLARAQGFEIVVFDQEPAEMTPKKNSHADCADQVAHRRTDGDADEPRPTVQACPADSIIQGLRSCVQAISGRQVHDASAVCDSKD